MTERQEGKKPSIKDIAKEAGVTISTVSHVLNKSKYVSEPTADRVRKAVKKLGYRPNRIARSLRTKSTRVVGVIVPDLANPFYALIIQEMERVARARGYTLILACTFYDLEEEKQQMQVLLDQFIDGMVFFGGYDSAEHIKEVQNYGVPVVAVDREITDPEIPAVLVDNVTAMENAVDYLFARGHRDIGYVTFSYEKQTVVRRRYEGYKKGLSKHNLPYRDDFVIIDDSTKLRETAGTYQVVKDHFSKNPMPTAFVTLSDSFAYGLIKAMKDLGKRVPEDISVVGFCDNQIGEYVEPGLTTIVQPMSRMGSSGMNMLIDMIESNEWVTSKIFLQAELLERSSVCRIMKHYGEVV